MLRDAPTHAWAEAVVQPAAFDDSEWVADASLNSPQEVFGVQEGKWHNMYSLSDYLWAAWQCRRRWVLVLSEKTSGVHVCSWLPVA